MGRQGAAHYGPEDDDYGGEGQGEEDDDEDDDVGLAMLSK